MTKVGVVANLGFLSPFFIPLGGPQAHGIPQVEMTKVGVVANLGFLSPFFIPLGGPQAHEFFGRDDKSRCSCQPSLPRPIFIPLGGPQTHERSVENHPGRPALPAVGVSHPCCARMGHPKSASSMGPKPPPVEMTNWVQLPIKLLRSHATLASLALVLSKSNAISGCPTLEGNTGVSVL